MLLILGLMLLGGAVFLVGEVATLPARQRQSSVRRAATYGRFRLPGAPPQLKFRERVLAPASSSLAGLVLKLNPRVTVETVRLKRCRVVWITRTSEEEWLLSWPEDEKIGNPIAEMLCAGRGCDRETYEATEKDQSSHE